MTSEASEVDRRLETTLHDGTLERALEIDDALELVIDVPFVRAHHGRSTDHRYVVRAEGVVTRHLAQWSERDAAFHPIPWRDEPRLAIVHVHLACAPALTRLHLEGHTDRSAWTELVIECARVSLAESDGTTHDAASFAALGRAYWDAWSRRHARSTDRDGGA